MNTEYVESYNVWGKYDKFGFLALGIIGIFFIISGFFEDKKIDQLLIEPTPYESFEDFREDHEFPFDHILDKAPYLKGKRIYIKGDYSNIWGYSSHIRGDCTKLRGFVSNLRGYVSNLRGDCSRLIGDCSYLSGDCTGFYGDCTGIFYNLDTYKMTNKERIEGVNIEKFRN